MDKIAHMNIQQPWKFVAGVVLLGLAFSFGYWMGERKHSVQINVPSTLSNTDMTHAFGTAKSSAHESVAQKPEAMSLSGLVAGLEKKVAANPENIDQQLLLAQTYKELDQREKSLQLLQSLNKKSPKNVQVKIALATILITGEERQELNQSIKLFDEAIKLQPDVASMAHMYQGEARVKLDNLGKK